MNTNIGDEEEMEKHLETPLTENKVKELHAGDYVYISGTVYTARDAAHKRMYEAFEKHGSDKQAVVFAYEDICQKLMAEWLKKDAQEKQYY